MYALQDYIGEEALNQALRRFLEAQTFQGPPYVTSPELLDYLREAVPAELQYLLTDMFETITLYDNRIVAATYRERDDGTYLVELRTAARKLRADGQGMETEIPIDDWIDVGVFGEERIGRRRAKEKVLFMEKRHINAAEMSFEVVVDERPVRAGIDPYNKLIDRVADDNVRRVALRTDGG
ncbi:MAG: hypothetical protein GY856_08270 [bacterium]|nr:hypothetical protein [bacterium]